MSTTEKLEQKHVRVPIKMQIPPAPEDPLNVAYAEGWNQCCDAFFGGIDADPPLIIETIKETVPATLVQAIHEFIEKTTHSRNGQRYWTHHRAENADVHVERLLTALQAAS